MQNNSTVELPQTFAQDLRWKRPIPQSFRANAAGYLHIYDGNSTYLAACTSVRLGSGMPTYSENIIYDERQPGLYEIDLQVATAFSEKRTQGLWGLQVATAFYGKGTQWLWGPEVAHLFSSGFFAPIKRGYVWNEYHVALRKWAETLWGARTELRNARKDARFPMAASAAYDSVKSVATQGLGLLAHKPEHGVAGEYYRPDWWNLVVSEARARMMYKISVLIGGGSHVVWANVDAIGVVSDESDPSQAVWGFLDKQERLGGFKHDSTLLLTPELAAAFEDSVPFRTAHKLINTMKEASKNG